MNQTGSAEEGVWQLNCTRINAYVDQISKSCPQLAAQVKRTIKRIVQSEYGSDPYRPAMSIVSYHRLHQSKQRLPQMISDAWYQTYNMSTEDIIRDCISPDQLKHIQGCAASQFAIFQPVFDAETVAHPESIALDHTEEFCTKYYVSVGLSGFIIDIIWFRDIGMYEGQWGFNPAMKCEIEVCEIRLREKQHGRVTTEEFYNSIDRWNKRDAIKSVEQNTHDQAIKYFKFIDKIVDTRTNHHVKRVKSDIPNITQLITKDTMILKRVYSDPSVAGYLATQDLTHLPIPRLDIILEVLPMLVNNIKYEENEMQMGIFEQNPAYIEFISDTAIIQCIMAYISEPSALLPHFNNTVRKDTAFLAWAKLYS